MALLSSQYLNSPISCMELYAYYGENVLPYGYPAWDGQVFQVGNNTDGCDHSEPCAADAGRIRI